jgi:asparagine synthase (glutamine-hydrolysing)
MCGLAGFVGSFEPSLLKNMTDAIAHRGPDGEGHWIDGMQGVGLGHRRLSIIDLSEAASQPMSAVRNRYMVVFNGEIYNYKTLAADLKRRGYQFNEKSDTAILGPLYDSYGPGMLNKLNGIFSIAIWDRKDQTLFVARDHLGIKPLYYALCEKGLLFASEMKALLQHEALPRSMNPTAMFNSLTYLWSAGEDTMFGDVKKLLPGHYMLYSEEGLRVKTWYTPPMPELDKKGQPIYDKSLKPVHLLDLFDDVVRDQLVADVPVGAFLSGGVDSSAIVASIMAQDKRPLKTFCIGFDDARFKKEGFSDDSEYARIVAKHTGAILEHVTAESNGMKHLSEMVYALDEPQADPAPLYVAAISKKAREHNIKVLMGGTGGDDIFSGYRRHQAIMLMQALEGMPSGMKGAMSAGLGLIQAPSFMKRRAERLRYILGNNIQDAMLSAFHSTPAGMTLSLLSDDMKKEFANYNGGYLNEVRQMSIPSSLDSMGDSTPLSAQHPLNQMLFMEQHGFLPDHNLNYTDKLGMAEGVEIRVPFLDPRLLSFAAKLPINQKCNGKRAKIMLKKAMEPRLPKKVLYRSKAGFGAPVRSWIVDDNADMVRDILMGQKAHARGWYDVNGIEELFNATKAGKVDGAYTLLSLLTVELWAQQFMDSSVPKRMVA